MPKASHKVIMTTLITHEDAEWSLVDALISLLVAVLTLGDLIAIVGRATDWTILAWIAAFLCVSGRQGVALAQPDELRARLSAW